ncbi:hypothetical protein [Streptomyces tsukubensis]|uniref:hypothetical protein n=1 Tax=Streptomyces tsukubensis TaxID=83656 RepID=UPI00386629D1
MRGYERQESHQADDDHLSRFEAEMKRLKTEREKAVQHADDLGYQVEGLRAKLHEARRNLASRPAYDAADIGYQAEQMLRNARSRPISCGWTRNASCATPVHRHSGSSRSTRNSRPSSSRSCTRRP